MVYCVFCSSSQTASPTFFTAIEEFSKSCAKKGHTLLYGGGTFGLMGKAADSALSEGGTVIGVMPQFLTTYKEIMHPELSQTVIVETLMERKQRMMDLSDAFVIFPGGLGTLDEFFEVLTWKQLNQLDKSIHLLNIEGFYDTLLKLFNELKEQNMVGEDYANLFQAHTTVHHLIDALI